MKQWIGVLVFFWQWLKSFSTLAHNPSTWKPPLQSILFVCSLTEPSCSLFPLLQPRPSLSCCGFLYFSPFFTLYQNGVFLIQSTVFFPREFRLDSVDLIACEQRTKDWTTKRPERQVNNLLQLLKCFSLCHPSVVPLKKSGKLIQSKINSIIFLYVAENSYNTATLYFYALLEQMWLWSVCTLMFAASVPFDS